MRPQRKHSLSILPFPPPLDFLAVPDFQAVQFSIFTSHRFVTTSMKVAIFITQISHHPWSNTAGTVVENCHNVRFFCPKSGNKCCCAVNSFSRYVGHSERRIAQSHVFRQLVSSAFSMALFHNFPGLDGVREVVNVGSLRWRQDLPAVVQTPPSC